MSGMTDEEREREHQEWLAEQDELQLGAEVVRQVSSEVRWQREQLEAVQREVEELVEESRQVRISNIQRLENHQVMAKPVGKPASDEELVLNAWAQEDFRNHRSVQFEKKHPLASFLMFSFGGLCALIVGAGALITFGVWLIFKLHYG